MNIIASRLPAIKFLMLAGGIQLGLTLFSNVLLPLTEEYRNAHVECQLVR